MEVEITGGLVSPIKVLVVVLRFNLVIGFLLISVKVQVYCRFTEAQLLSPLETV